MLARIVMRLPHLLFRLSIGLSMIGAAQADTIRVAVGTQDTTINCATGGLLIRELDLLKKYLPRKGKYKDAVYDIQWKNFTSGAPLTNEMVAGKLDFGAMADFPGSLNGVAFKKAGKRSLFISVLSGSVKGSGNGDRRADGSSAQSLADLKGKTISVPFASTAHGMLLRAVKAQGWDLEKDVQIISQAPGSRGLRAAKQQDRWARRFCSLCGAFPRPRVRVKDLRRHPQADTPTFHGVLVDADYAEKYPEIVVAYLKAAIEANRLVAAEPEKYSELIAKVSGIEAPVIYLFHGPLGLQTRDFSGKPEYRKDVATSVETLKLLKRADTDLDLDAFIVDKYIRQAFAEFARSRRATRQLCAVSAQGEGRTTGAPISDLKRVAQIWLKGEPLVRHYASPDGALRLS